MIFIPILFTILIVALFIMIYSLILEGSNFLPRLSNWLNPFKKPIFKIPIGILIILGTLIYSFNLVKILPVIMKIVIIGLDFIIIFIVINYLFNNKQKTK